MTRYTIGISPGKLTGIAIYDSEENNLMTYVDFEDTETAQQFVLNRRKELIGTVESKFDNMIPQEWWDYCNDTGLKINVVLRKQWPSPSDIFAETGIKISNQPLANAVTMAMEKMKV